MFVIVIILIVLAIFVFMQFLHSESPAKTASITYCGTMGSGKTFLAVKTALSRLKLNRFIYYIKKPFKKDLKKPLLLSNIPIKVGRREMSSKLTKEHLTAIHLYSDTEKYFEYAKDIPPNSVLLIDEIGQIVDQYSYKQVVVQDSIQPLVRFCRHWRYDLILTDQVADNIAKPVRSRLGTIYNLLEFKRYLFFFYKVEFIPFIVANDNVNQTDTLNVANSKYKYFFGIIPFKRKYDSLCHSELYKRKNSVQDVHSPNTLKADYFIDLDKKERK